ncbi:MAG: DUF1365 domain-containing protein [Candidatus Melainabacteria bacterium]|nr:DUF1365 domain-containing protein [Candidatus Melainabacteria bacterium]
MIDGAYIYDCRITHHRLVPRRHSFSLRHFMFLLPLMRLDGLASACKLLSINAFNIYSFHHMDYLSCPDLRGLSLIERVQKIVRDAGITVQLGSVSLLTNVRVLNYIFNPISFYYCYDVQDQLACCICEVSNTFREKKIYVINANAQGRLLDQQKKLFYVSPFARPDDDFKFDIGVPGLGFRTDITTVSPRGNVLEARMVGQQKPLSDGQLIGAFFVRPFATAQVIWGIHFQALLLWLKGVPYRRKQQDADLQIGYWKAPGNKNEADSVIGK